MKKSHYLHYLKDFEAKKSLETSKTFKQPKKHSTVHNPRNSNPKNKQPKAIAKHEAIPDQQRLQDKQNQHPNFLKIGLRQLKPTLKPTLPQKLTHTMEYQSTAQASGHEFKAILKDQSIKQQRQRQFSISLTKCNFQPSHNSTNLFLVEAETNSEFIVCEQCSKKFSKRLPIASFGQQKSKHSYAEMVRVLQNLESKNKQLNRVMLIQKESIENTLDEVGIFYDKLISVIMEKKDELQTVLVQAYNQNEAKIKDFMKKNQESITFMNQVIQKMQKRCIKRISSSTLEENDQLQKIEKIMGELNQNDQIELSCISQQIPIEILSGFQKDFAQSKYCINFFRQQQSLKNSFEDQQVLSKNDPQEFVECPIETKNRIDSSLDYEKQIPFNVQHSETTEKIVHFPQKLDEQLSKMSSSEELLIESLRNHDSRPKLHPNLSAPFIVPLKSQENMHQLEKDSTKIEKENSEKELRNLGKGFNFKTESSTCRTLPPENSHGKHNFIKQLHIEHEDFTDLLCDEDLTLSSSHPIHEKPMPHGSNMPRKSLKLSYNPHKRNQQPLTLEQLSSEMSQPQKKPEILNPSVISANENKNEISFELDENMLIDANILPTQELDQENLDIISPAFKII